MYIIIIIMCINKMNKNVSKIFVTLLAAFLLLNSNSADAAFFSLGSLGSVQSKVANQATLTLTTTAAAETGHLGTVPERAAAFRGQPRPAAAVLRPARNPVGGSTARGVRGLGPAPRAGQARPARLTVSSVLLWP